MQLVANKLFEFSEACVRREELRKDRKVVALTNGCFDLLHAGHVFSLESAKASCDSLWIALNSDSSVRSLKCGDANFFPKNAASKSRTADRPIFGELERAYVLSALKVVDGIFIFHGTRLAMEIVKFCPDIYVKSADYTLETLDPSEMKALQSIGATVKFVPFLEGFSSTSIVSKIRNC
jgi:rfaE bifunctional protein nucleotidyltransferase chain/domain